MVEVVWVDAVLISAHEGDIGDIADAKSFGGSIVCSDVGYLIRMDEREIVLAIGLCRGDNTYRHSNTIPRGCILSLKRLRVRGHR